MPTKKEKQHIELEEQAMIPIYELEIEVDKAQRKLSTLLNYSLKAESLSEDILKQSADVVRITHKLQQMKKIKGVS